MTSDKIHQDHAEAYLILHHSSFGDGKCNIRANDDFDIGRECIREWCGITDATISAHHLRFHCVVFENDPDQDDDRVEPLVYVRVLSTNPVRFTSSCFNNTSILRKGDRDVLLNHGDVLVLNPTISITFQSAHPPIPNQTALNPLQQTEVKRFHASYAVSDRLLGSGGQASVFLATKQSDRSQLACKVIRLPRPSTNIINDSQNGIENRELAVRLQKTRDGLAREYSILKDVSHPNIVTMEKVFCTTYNIYIMQELLTGGDLLSYLDKTSALDEPEAAVIVRQVLKAVDYLHDQNIAHRDIKPENVLMTSWRPGARVVLTDFGQARILASGNNGEKSTNLFRMQSMVGTYGYAAPEIFKRYKQDDGYSKAIDIWSVGCIAGTMLTGEPMPFEQEGQDWSVDFIDSQRQWRKVGSKAKSFIRACLTFDETLRPSAKEALMHDWFMNKHYADDLEAAYQRAIQGWTPRVSKSGLIEFVDTSDIVLADLQPPACDDKNDQVCSHHFPTKAPSALDANAASMNGNSVPLFRPMHDATSAYLAGELVSEDGTALFASPVRIPDSPLGYSHSNSFSDIVTATYDADAETQVSQWPGMMSGSQIMLD